MSSPKRIVCAVRGGPESRATISRAIDLAVEYNAKLTFFHVVDAEFLGHAPIRGTLSVIYNELHEMGVFAMLILVDRAERRGVSHVDYLVREGNIRKHLHQFALETNAEIMVLGKPTRSPGSNVFKPANFEEFVAQLKADGQLEIVTVTPDSST